MTAPVHRWGDASTYYMQMQSISNDFDIQYQSKDINRVFENKLDDIPSGMYLIKNEEGNYYYGKEFSYALFAAPFYKLLGNNGILFFNGLMLLIMILMGYLYLRDENGDKVALGVSVSYFILSTAFVYIFWITAEIYNMFLIMASLFFWERYFKNNNSKYLFIASFIFGLAFIAKLPNIFIFLPLLFYELYKKRFNNFFIMLLIFLIPVIAIYGYFFLNTGSISFYGGNRLYYLQNFPFVNGYDSINEAGEPAFSVSQDDRMDALISRDDIKVIPYNLFYYIFGKCAGMFWYYPFTLFALFSVFTTYSHYSRLSLRSKTRSNTNISYVSSNADKILILAGIILYIVFFCAVIGNNYLGGQHGLGNRYFYVYPAFIFLIQKIELKKAITVIFISILTLNPIILDPIGNSISPFKHETSFPYPHFPIEYTQLDNLPFWNYSQTIDDFTVYRLDDESKYSGDAFIVNGSTDMMIRSENKIETLILSLSSKNAKIDASINFGNTKQPLKVNNDNVKAVILKVEGIKPVYMNKRYCIYTMSISSPDELNVTLKNESSINT